MKRHQPASSGLRVLSFAQTSLLGLFRVYKRALSPFLPVACRYVPTCSEYAAEAVERHGVLRGSALAAGRVLRCHPFVRGGFDPVPPKNVPSDALNRGAGGARTSPRLHGSIS
ncbi:MAG TPA: membrane protein insertion efficiency factor YidD [Bryobacterales bacterium]|nr:membrane protein insertion efficiency factor YidD [Bryobacterales bacterium]